MAFSTISLFKVNLLPGGADEENRFAISDLEQAKKLIAIEKTESRYENIERAVERETEFVEKFDSDLKPRRMERIGNEKDRQ